jgi:hypothetical protein
VPFLPSNITNAKIEPDTTAVQEFTRYALTFSVTVPMYKDGCTIAIYLPSPDFKLSQTPISDVQGFGLFGNLRSYQFQVSANENSIVIRDACASNFILPTIPATIYIFGLRNTEVAKQLDPIRIKIWNKLNGEVAELTTANSPTLQITTGSISNFSITTPTTQINALTEFTVTFKFQHEAISDISSSEGTKFPARITITISDLDFIVSPFVRILDTNVPGDRVRIEVSPLKQPNVIVVSSTIPQIVSDGTVYFIRFDQMQISGSR